MRKRAIAGSVAAACILSAAIAATRAPAAVTQSAAVEPGRFIWRDLMSSDVEAAKRFYGELLGWRFENTRRGDRPYVLAKANGTPVAGIVDVSSIAGAGSQWLSFMSVADVDQTVRFVKSEGGAVLVDSRNLPMARVAVVTDPQGAPLGLAQPRRAIPDSVQPVRHQFFWQEYLARDAEQALGFYKRLAGYQSVLLESRMDIDYHVLRATHGRAGLFRLPPSVVDVLPNWLPYVLADDPAALVAQVSALGGRIVVPASADRRKGSLVVIADPSGAVLALQKYPF